jgi:hypothetical protein
MEREKHMMKGLLSSARTAGLMLALLCLALTSFSQLTADGEWKLAKEENGISVYTRESTTSSFSELKVTSTFETTMSAIIALFKDIPNYTAWVYSCTVSRSVKTSTEGEDYYYSVTDAPWPVSNRDVVVHSKVTQDTGTWIVTSASTHANGLVDENEDMVRVPMLQSAWTLIPLKDGKVDITYHLSVDPGGLIPSWLANMTLAIGPYNTMLGLKREVADEKYRDARFHYIHEPYLPKKD